MLACFKKIAVVLVGLFIMGQAIASGDLSKLREDWAHIKYETPKAQKLSEFEGLIAKASALAKKNPQSAEYAFWHGTILSTYASIKGGLSALQSLEEARDELQRSISLNPKAEGAAAHAILGTIYYRVPGWPVGFKDKSKAKDNLNKAIQLNPKGLETNFFYAEWLRNTGFKAQSKAYYQKALQAEARKEQPMGDRGRRNEIEKILSGLK